MRAKMSKQPPPAPNASAVGPCPTVIQIVGRPGTGSFPSTIAPPDHPGFDPWSSHIISFLAPLIQEEQLSVTGKVMYTYPTNRKRYHNVSIWLYVGLVATQYRINLIMMFAMSCRKVMLKSNIGKRCCNF